MRPFSVLLALSAIVAMSGCDRRLVEGEIDLGEADAQAEQQWIDLMPESAELDGWRVLGGSADFRIEPGPGGREIVGTARDPERNTFLASQQTWGDFVLELEFRVDGELNSGVQLRSAVRSPEGGGAGDQVVYGYQAEIDPSPRGWTAGIYDEARRGWLYPVTLNPDARTLYRPGEWNRMRIVALGDEIRTWLNGEAVAHLIDDASGEGFVALQVHAAPSELHGTEVRWRNLRLGLDPRPAPDDAVPYVVNTRVNDLAEAEARRGWTRLFDGESAAGWRGAHAEEFPEAGWQVAGGELSVLATTGGEAAGGGDIVTEDEYGAFELQLEFRLSQGANSGIKYFVTEDYASTGSAIGVEYQLLDDERHPDATQGRDGNRTLASLYDLIPADKQPRFVRPPGEWNHARLVVRPDRSVEHWLNHQKVLEYTLGSAEFLQLVQRSKYRDWEGFGLWTSGHLLLQDHGDAVSFRSIKVRELGALAPAATADATTEDSP
ncbi:MAG: DUF1080 domain-containing protein [Acidobacteria bacterium]|nr:MAG: DUF1080 domain-containing protein [Acidobacteriota bacterium]REK03865.1 MAG: DUF1080 domain-containing protein [Acidobacteriota bacterium]